MTVNKLTVKQFRNIKSAELVPSDGINVIFGSNAQGKTNLIEALWLLCGQKSFRGGRDSEFLSFGCDECLIKANFTADGREQTAEIKIDKKKTASLNGIELKSVSELSKSFNAVVFSPDDLAVISDGPEERRKFADGIIASLYPKYEGIVSRYERAIAQRNMVLSDFRYHSELEAILDNFEEQAARYGNEIVIYRSRFCEKLSAFSPDIYSGISDGKEKMSVKYISSAGNGVDEFKSSLKASRAADSKTLATSVGPHRDDFEILIDGMPARKFASQGQKRSAAITLKLSEAALIRDMTDNMPVILLDDVMSELDKKRQAYVLNKIKDSQVFITCCDPSNIKGLKAGKVFEVRNGEIV